MFYQNLPAVKGYKNKFTLLKGNWALLKVDNFPAKCFVGTYSILGRIQCVPILQ